MRDINFPNPVESKPMFFGRDEALLDIVSTLQSGDRKPILILGERVTGKTSTLNVVAEWARAKDNFRVLQLPPVTSREALIEEILDGLAGESDTSLSILGMRSGDGRLQVSSITEFVAAAQQLCSRLDDAIVVVSIDELDSMLLNCNNADSTQILDLLTHIVERTTLPIKFVFSSTWNVPPVVMSAASPVVTSARVVTLEPFNREEASRFVNWIVGGEGRLSLSGHERLFAACGGHPYLTKAVLYAAATGGLIDDGDQAVPLDVVEQAIGAALGLREVEFTLENISKVHFSSGELDLLRRLADGPAAVDDEDVDPSSLESLVRRHYVVVGHGGNIRQAFEMFGDWLKRHSSIQGNATARRPITADPDDTKAMITVDATRNRVFVRTEEVALTPDQYALLDFFSRHIDMIVTKPQVLAAVWPDDQALDGPDNRLDSLVSRLRRQLRRIDDNVEIADTRRGLGYYIDPRYLERKSGLQR